MPDTNYSDTNYYSLVNRPNRKQSVFKQSPATIQKQCPEMFLRKPLEMNKFGVAPSIFIYIIT